ncbi:hypothetical protein H2199_006938 [Coniosporium tulheliwenetii]|uniref:Uncharacterized protein n=1 Tax=Coniosporium tulheliwenetii TaxID=3383036 RepID=A0ACC2YSK3_9PEZI|nr:hypothetical protein H2199_006938 [Cladosporium sp. JES 115]
MRDLSRARQRSLRARRHHTRPGRSTHPGRDRRGSSRDRILVETGTYAEQLTIETDGIALVGLGAILVPPAAPTQNNCSGLAGPDTQAGICVMGYEVDLADFVVEHRRVRSVGQPVKDVSISGFQVRGFPGANIAVVGARDARVIGNRLVDGEHYGFLTAGSKNTRVAGNTVVSSTKLQFIGICMDDLAGVQVSKNHISGYNTGLCVQTHGADVRHNDVSDSCIGVFVDPKITGAKIRHNHISATDPRCATESFFGVYGIFIYGAVNTEVRHNIIEGQTDGGLPDQFAAGLAVVDGQTLEGAVAVASGNVVTKNTLRNNDLDLLVETEGTGNVIARNKCSTPEELCA